VASLWPNVLHLLRKKAGFSNAPEKHAEKGYHLPQRMTNFATRHHDFDFLFLDFAQVVLKAVPPAGENCAQILFAKYGTEQ